MRVLVTGATGYIGGRLVPALLLAGHDVRCVARLPERLAGRFPGVDIVQGDVFDLTSMRAALDGIDVAYYLIHSMAAHDGDFAESDRIAAGIFGDAARDAGVKRIVFLGGLGIDDSSLSHHLRSRHEVGDILRRGGAIVTEFRAAIIVGAGSISFEMIRYLTERLPIMVAPKWVSTRCQPVATRNVIDYLVAALGLPLTESATYEIGGNYQAIAKRASRTKNGVSLSNARRAIRSKSRVMKPWLPP